MSETKPKVMELIEKWEDSAFENGRMAERERIIKLLQDLRAKAQKTKGLTTNINVNAVIALIRGEQK